MHIRGWHLLALFIFSISLIYGCDYKQKEARDIDNKLTMLYDKGCDISDSIKFLSEFESALSNPATFLFSLDSLSTRIRIKKYENVKSYELAMPVCKYVSEAFVVQTEEHCIYIQYQGDAKKSYWLNIDENKEENKGYRNKEWIRDIYTIRDQGNEYYAVVTFLYDEDDELQTGKDSGGMIRVYRKDGNMLVKTNELFPSPDMFDQVLSLSMDNFAFDPNTNTVSYDEYGYTEDNDDMKVTGRTEWQLKYY